MNNIETPWLKTKGRIVYDPRRGDMTKNIKNWCVVEVDPEIGRYYRWWIDRHWYEIEYGNHKRKVDPPPWNPHVSIIRGEKIDPVLRNELWRKYHGVELEIEYEPIPLLSGGRRPEHFYYIHARHPIFRVIRHELGLPYQYDDGRGEFSYHITVGRYHP